MAVAALMTNQSLSSELIDRGETTAAIARSMPQPSSLSPRRAEAAFIKSLWLCVYFPELPLETAGYQAKQAQPFAIFEQSSSRRLVYMASAAASTTGIARGMQLSQAYALCPTLEVKPRDAAAEMKRLRRLAAWAGQFTPMISLQSPQALLLEISGSLRLFGGLAKLKGKLSDSLAASGACAHVAITPTPLASLLLASQGRTVVLSGQETLLDESEQVSRIAIDARGSARSRQKTSRHAIKLASVVEISAGVAETQTRHAAAHTELSLRAALSKLPVSALPLDADSIRRLTRMGVKNFHDLWRLPREGLARRFGSELLNFLDRALGLEPDPRHAFHPPPRFTAELELPWETDDTAALLEAAHRLFTKLGKFLHAHDGAVTRLRLTLHHMQLPPSRLEIGTRHGTRDEEYLLSLLKEHLHRFRLPAAACKLRLTTVAIQPFTASNQVLFAKHGFSETHRIHPLASNSPFIPPFALNPPQPPFTKGGLGGFHKREQRSDLAWDWQQVLEQLQARLGRKTVHGLEISADHRPERAWGYTEPGQSSHATFNRRRPLWLLPAPRPLASRQGRPWRRGPLSIVEGPERIEGGWWDDRDISRDYYLAKDTDSSRLWIFHDLRGDRSWYLHGLFG